MADFISITLRHRLLAPVILWAGLAGGLGAADDTGTAGEYRLLELEGTVQVMRSGANVWDKAYTNQVLYPGDQLQTEMRSRAVVRWSDLTLHRVGERSLIQIPQQEKSGAVIEEQGQG